MFLERRLGKSIKVSVVEPVIEDILASIQRNPNAFNGLMRCKRDNDYIYRHALAASALMISLARQMKLPPAQNREAGMAGQARGLIVDTVSDIVTIAADALQAPPTTSIDGVVPFIEGLAAIDEQMVMVLDLEKLNADAQVAEAA